MVAIIGKTCSDVPESEALKYVLGYAVGNDISHREWQIQRGGGQWSLGKGFDGWAPVSSVRKESLLYVSAILLVHICYCKSIPNFYPKERLLTYLHYSMAQEL